MPVCTTPMCTDGRTAVVEMEHTFSYLKQNYPTFNQEYFGPAVASIRASLDAVDSIYADWIPFNPTCCTIEEIGSQADLLTNQMLQSVGASGVPAPPPAGTDWFSIALLGGLALVAIAYAPTIQTYLPKRKRR